METWHVQILEDPFNNRVWEGLCSQAKRLYKSYRSACFSCRHGQTSMTGHLGRKITDKIIIQGKNMCRQSYMTVLLLMFNFGCFCIDHFFMSGQLEWNFPVKISVIIISLNYQFTNFRAKPNDPELFKRTVWWKTK